MKKYRSISEKILNNIPLINDWLDKDFIKINNLAKWDQSIKSLHIEKKPEILIQIIIDASL